MISAIKHEVCLHNTTQFGNNNVKGGKLMFIPSGIYYEKDIENYELGKELLYKYKDVPMKVIESHNNIEEMRKKENKDFPELKRNLIIGIRKTHKYVENHKVSNFLVPYTSSRMYRNVYVLLFGVQL